MKQLHATTLNVENDILGKITLSGKNIFVRKDYIFVQKDCNSCPSGYSATITNGTALNGNRPIAGGVNLEEFHEGDVVSINKEGEITFLYEINSTSNAVFATGMCNHRCIMCPQPPVTHENDMTPFNMKLISLFDKNTQEIGITGGEPTMIGDKLFDLIKQIKKYTPKAAISILSNGVKFADRDYAMKLALCNCCDLQIDVPVFSDIAELHNEIVGAPTFYKTVQGLYNLALFGIKIGIRVVVHKKTYKRLPQLADYIYHNFPFVCNVAFMQMETIGMAEENIEELWIDPFDYNKQLVEAVEILRSRGLNASVYNAQLCVLPESIRDTAIQSISEWKDIYMDECGGCKLMGKCGGFFASNRKYHSSHIHPLETIPSKNDIEC